MACFPIRWTASVARDLIVALCVALCCISPPPGLAHPTTDSRIDDLNRRIASEPDNAGLFLQRGELHRERHDWARAEADYAESRRLDPDLAVIDLGLARLRLDTGRNAEAMALLDRYLTVASNDGAALALRARLRGEAGEHLAAAADYGRAIDAWRAAGALPPPHLYLGRAAALVAAGEGYAGEALRGLDHGLELLGRPVTLEFVALDLELRLGRFDAALTRVDRRLSDARRPGPWLIRRAQVLESAGRYAEARLAYQGARADFATRSGGRRDAPAVVRQLDSIDDALVRVDAHLNAGEGRTND